MGGVRDRQRGFDAGAQRALTKLEHQLCADAAPLPFVDYRDRNLGLVELADEQSMRRLSGSPGADRQCRHSTRNLHQQQCARAFTPGRERVRNVCRKGHVVTRGELGAALDRAG
ncbi:MAG TPA: hypothetical protein VES97_12920, partial [Solirubrobacteraceae bacterium]|nr:hypothetical protein [Solirubrobacteraceae bacterium]